VVNEGVGPILAVIPTYRPPRDLLELIEVLSPQVSAVVVADDGSPCTFDPVLRSAAQAASVVRNPRNHGIARGLNQGLSAAIEANAYWLLTIDQDSRMTPHYVESLLENASAREDKGAKIGAIGAELIADASGELRYPLRSTAHGPVTEELIQTGTLWKVDALVNIGGFDEGLAIDAVDAEACLGLREAGYTIAVAPGTMIDHRIGNATTVSMMGRNVMVTGHTPERRSSMLRNRLRLFPREFRQNPRHALRTIRRVTLNQTLGLVVPGPKPLADRPSES